MAKTKRTVKLADVGELARYLGTEVIKQFGPAMVAVSVGQPVSRFVVVSQFGPGEISFRIMKRSDKAKEPG